MILDGTLIAADMADNAVITQVAMYQPIDKTKFL
jgi:hypothetical protein